MMLSLKNKIIPKKEIYNIQLPHIRLEGINTKIQNCWECHRGFEWIMLWKATYCIFSPRVLHKDVQLWVSIMTAPIWVLDSNENQDCKETHSIDVLNFSFEHYTACHIVIHSENITTQYKMQCYCLINPITQDNFQSSSRIIHVNILLSGFVLIQLPTPQT